MDNSKEYGFKEKLIDSNNDEVSKKIINIIIDNVPNALQVFKSHESNDRLGTDWWIELSNGKFISVDAKIRDEDWSAKNEKFDDLALEIWSVVERNIIGWTRSESKQTDYILWFWKDTERWCLIPFQMLCKVFKDNWVKWSNEFKTARQLTTEGNYHSECVFVSRKIVWSEIYKRYSGVPQPA